MASARAAVRSPLALLALLALLARTLLLAGLIMPAPLVEGAARPSPLLASGFDLVPNPPVAPASATPGQQIDVSWVVTNAGSSTLTGMWTDKVYLSTDATLGRDDTHLGSQTITTTVSGGGTYGGFTTVTVPNVSSGLYYLLVHVDATNSVTEDNEVNNESFKQISITAPTTSPTATSTATATSTPSRTPTTTPTATPTATLTGSPTPRSAVTSTATAGYSSTPTATPTTAGPRVAYVYDTDTASRDSFSSLLTSRGYAVDAVALGAASTHDFSPYTTIVVGDDTGRGYTWGPAGAATNVGSAGKPVVGVGAGGASFFSQLGTSTGTTFHIDWGHSWIVTAGTGVIVVDPSNPIWSSPNSIPATTGANVTLYTSGTSYLAAYNPEPIAGVTRIGRQTDDSTHYPLIAQASHGVCHTLWGFSRSPATMSGTGEDLFINALRGQSCSGGETPPSDTSPPAASITSPTAGSTVNASALSSLTLTGTATDTGSGVAGVTGKLARTLNGTTTHWDGSAWASAGSVYALTTTLGTPFGASTTWTVANAPSGAQWGDGVFTLTVRATDLAGNVGPETSVGFSVDQTAPGSAVLAPAHGRLYHAGHEPTSLYGTAHDPPSAGASGVASVQVSLQRLSDGAFWNGSSWAAAETPLSVSGTTSWSRSTGLPAGRGAASCASCWADGTYRVRSRATDGAGNTEPPDPAPAPNSSTVEFKITSQPPPAPLPGAWARSAPSIDGTVTSAEWGTAPSLPLPHGKLRYQNDASYLYLLLDVTGDTHDDPLGGTGQPDYFHVTFDVNRDASITPQLDLNFGLVSGSGGGGSLCRQRYIGPGTFTGCTIVPADLGMGFGPSPDSTTPHRTWELRFALTEIGSAPGQIVRIGVETTSQNPPFSDVVPDSFSAVFTQLTEIYLATGPAALPDPPVTFSADGHIEGSLAGARAIPFGGVAYAAGRAGAAFGLNGSSAFLRIPPGAPLTPAALTVGFWFKSDTTLDSSTAHVPLVMSLADADDALYVSRGYDFYYEGGALGFGLPTTGGARQAVLHGVTIPAGTWHHVAGTYDSSGQRLFLNGVQVASRASWGAIQYTGAPITLGRGRNGAFSSHAAYASPFFFKGAIDELQVYPTALTAAEIAAIAAAPTSGGTSVTVPSSPTSRGVTLSNVRVNRGGNSATVAPGAHFVVDLDYVIQDPECPGCVDQIEVGFSTANPTHCAYSGIPGAAGVSGHHTMTFAAPAYPGTYYLAFDRAQHYSCAEALAHAAPDGTAWWNGAPPVAQYLAAITVSASAVAWPAGSTLTAGSVGSSSLTLTWTPAAPGTAVTHYKIYQDTSDTPLATLPGTTLTHDVTGLANATRYTFSIQACDAAGCTANGPSVTVTTGINITGVAECGGAVLPGATVELLSGSVVVATTTSGPTGQYAFTGIASGATYSLRYRATVGGVPLSCGATFVTPATGTIAVPAAPACPDLGNRTWLSARELTSPATLSDHLCRAGQSSWYRIRVRPGQQVTVTLGSLPANYDLALYRDLARLASTLRTETLDQVRLLDAATSGARAAPIDSAPIDSAPIDSAPIDSAPIDSAPIDSAPIDSAPIDSAPIDSAPIDSAPIDSAPIDSAPIDSAPIDSAPIDSAPIDSAPIDSAAYTSAQAAGLLALSARAGTAAEVVLRNTWDHDGDFYIRVFGSNGAFDAGVPFTLEAHVDTIDCAGVSLAKTPPTGSPTATPRTLILTNTERLGLAGTDAATFLSRLRTFAGSVGGVVVDLKDDAGIRENYTRWDAPTAQACALAANVVAESIHDLIRRYRTPNPAALEYVVLAGGDSVIPFLRVPDHAEIANERSYDPPVRDSTASQASLRQGYFLSQDYYGSFTPVTRLDHTLHLPELPVGRLVETPADIVAMLDAYDAATGAIRPASALSTGYSFLADLADHVADQLQQSGLAVHSLVERRETHQDAWTADDLRARLFGATRHDVLALNAHFSANRMLAANYASTLSATEIASRTDGRFRNTLVLSNGCHVAYNIVNGHAVPNLTQPMDFAQAFNRQGATLIGGTGYQYGDTEYILYTEALLANILRELRYGSGPVSVGKALVSAKRAYLGEPSALSGTDVKAAGQLTLYGLPMFGIDLPSNRLSRSSAPPVSPAPLAGGLAAADLTPSYTLTEHDVTLQALGGTTTFQATYFAADGAVQALPYRPLSPRETVSVAAPGTLARGAVLVEATYTDHQGMRPFVHVPSTEEPSIHPLYLSSVFAPIQPFGLNQLVGQSLVVTPFQYRSDGTATTGTGRSYTALSTRVYYSSETGQRALAGAPTIARTRVAASGSRLLVDVTAGGPTVAGIEDVLVTYTGAVPGSTLYGRWRSCSLIPGRTAGPGRTASCAGATAGAETVTGPHALTPYSGEIETAGTGAVPGDVRLFVQVVGGTGLVSAATNNGRYYAVLAETATVAAPKPATSLTLTAPNSARHRSVIELRASLAAAGTPLAGKSVLFSLGGARITATTDASGAAVARLPVDVLPRAASYRVTAAFAEDTAYLGASTSSDLSVTPGVTAFVPPAGSVTTAYSDSAILARLDAGAGRHVLNEQPVVVDLGGGRTFAAITDAYGRVLLDTLQGLAPGAYTAVLSYAGSDRYLAATSPPIEVTVAPEHATVTLPDLPAQPTGAVTLRSQVNQDADGALGDLARATVAFTLRPTGGGSATTATAPVTADGAASATVTLAPGIYDVEAVAGGHYTSSAARASLVVFDPAGRAQGHGFVHTTAGSVGLPPNARAQIGFNLRYQPGASAPTGDFTLRLREAGIDFEATSLEWLVVDGTRAAFQGRGTLNRAGSYRFSVTATGSGRTDTFELRVLNPDGSVRLAVANTLSNGNVNLR